MSEFDWLDTPPAAAPVKRRKRRKVRAAAKKPSKKPVRPATPPPVQIESKKIDHESIRGRAMFGAVHGKKRIWACDGQYVFFRRKSCLGPDGRTDGSGNVHLAVLRHDEALARGDYTYVQTQDDVEICKINESSPFFRKGLFLGEMDEATVQRQVILAACKMDWVLYTDALTELAGRIKSSWAYPEQGQLAWKERLTYLEGLIAMRGGPTRAHIAAGLQKVRQARGEGKGRVVLMPPR
jgi:hypothetical protein